MIEPGGPDDELVGLVRVKKLSGLGKTKIYQEIRKERFPAPYKPGGASSRWSLAEVLAWRRQLQSSRNV